MILKLIKAMAFLCLIAVVSVAIVVFGYIIGAVLVFLGTVFVIGVIIYIGWLTYLEHRADDD